MKKRSCKYCGEKYLPKYNMVEPCPKYECRVKAADKVLQKVYKAKKVEAKNSITDWQKKLQSKVQEIARLIDYGQPCLARNIPIKQAHGGHVFSRGGNKNFCLNLHNIFAQSAHSNHFQNDDGLMKDGVVRVFGEDYLEFIRGLKSTPMPKLTNEDYHRLYLEVACPIANGLRKELRAMTPYERILMRNVVNVTLGIYADKYNIYTLIKTK